MMDSLKASLIGLPAEALSWTTQRDFVTLSVLPSYYIGAMSCLYKAFDQLSDLTVIDKLTYGQAQWQTTQSTHQGFSRAQLPLNLCQAQSAGRFEVIVHLLSYQTKQRLRVRCALDKDLSIASLCALWPAANWYEREAFDLFGVYFTGHPDLRRILTDYGFNGFPFRKDFPMVGYDQVIYDATLERCTTEPVNITERIITPRVIRTERFS